MTVVQNPKKLVRLWDKIHERFGTGKKKKKPEELKKLPDKERKLYKEKDRIDKGLIQMRNVSKGGLQAAGKSERFTKLKDKTVKVLKKFCKLVKTVKVTEAKNLFTLRKMAKQFTISVDQLDPKLLTDEVLNDDSDPNVFDIEDVDTTEFDSQMEDANFGEYSEEDMTDLDQDLPEEEDAPSEDEVDPNSPLGQAMARFKKISGPYYHAIGIDSGNTSRLKTLFQTIQGTLNNQDHIQANTLLDEFEPLVRNTIDAGTKSESVEGAPIPQAPPAPDAFAVAVTQRLKTITADYKKAEGSGATEVNQLQTLWSTISGTIKNRDFEHATKLLDELEELIQQILAQTPEGQNLAQFNTRLKTILPQIKTVQGDNAAYAKELMLSVSEARTFTAKGKFDEANKTLDEILKKLVNVPAPNAEPVEDTEDSVADTPESISLVKLQQARLAWDTARKKALEEVNNLKKAILSEFQGEPEYGEAATAAATLENMLDNFDTRLLETLDEALKVAGEAREKLHKHANGLIEEYVKALAGDELLKELDTNPFQPVAVYKTLSDTLSVLKTRL